MATATTVPRVRALWDRLKSDLAANGTLTTVLKGSGRVFIEGDSGADVTPDSATGLPDPYRRLVIVPGIPLYTSTYAPLRIAPFLFLLRADMDDPGDQRPDLIPQYGLEAVLGAAHVVAEGWSPGVLGSVRVVGPAAMQSAPPGAPEWDEDRRCWWLSAQYKVEVVPIL